ncbi:MAG: ComEA family DNA-binding protein [Candidatus Hodarchaeales archaeon]
MTQDNPPSNRPHPFCSRLLIYINNASNDELQRIEGIGEKIAQNIEINRPYLKLYDLLNVSGINEENFNSLLHRVIIHLSAFNSSTYYPPFVKKWYIWIIYQTHKYRASLWKNKSRQEKDGGQSSSGNNKFRLLWLCVFLILLLTAIFLLDFSGRLNIAEPTSFRFNFLDFINTSNPKKPDSPIRVPTPSISTAVKSKIPNSTLTPTKVFPDLHTPTLIPKLMIFPDIYGCNIKIKFVSGPLDEYETEFNILEQTYFEEKADKFAPGMKTGIYYESQKYLILHSGYYQSKLSEPLEAEFLRKYLEGWGDLDKSYIEQQIDALIYSKIILVCDSAEPINLQLKEITRLSHVASNQLWVDPSSLFQVIIDREGESTEWIGNMSISNQNSLYLGFCGWGPPDIDQDRMTYFRYVMRFEVFE